MQHLNKNTATATQYRNLTLNYDEEYQSVWVELRYPGRPCISTGLLTDLAAAQKEIAASAGQGIETDDPMRLRYQILCSNTPGVFNLGGDLEHFIKLIRAGDRATLFDYAKSCVDILYSSITGYDLPFTTIALVQGETLGGGFEAALSANVLIAERSAKFGFPETVFGMFPGMGAYSFLARKLTPAMAKRIITSGKVYTADELYDLGVIDRIVPDGQGRKGVEEFIAHQQTRSAGFDGFEQVIEQFNPISYKELLDVVNIWVDTGMKLNQKNLRLMEYLLQAQEKRWARPELKAVETQPRQVVSA